MVMALLVFSVTPAVFAATVGTGITPDIETEDFPPEVWMCDHRVVYDDATEPGRISEDGQTLVERINNYAFEGEQIAWKVLVMDKNGVEKIEDVFATVGGVQGEGNEIEVNCQEIGFDKIIPSCNARILEEELTEFNKDMMQYYVCTLTVETPESMYGEYWITVEATDLDGLSGTMDENEYWFLNPVIALSIDGEMTFENVRPGTDTYSDTLLVGNDADEGSGVLMDMFISGTDFYDSSSSGAMCPTTNQLELDAFRYFATNGAYSTGQDPRKDAEGYVGIDYGIGFNNPNPFYNNNEIIQAQKQGPYYAANILAPGAEMALTFKLSLPEPCNGDFDSGSIYFWGEAI
ncbi:hypothetical protein A3K73_06750 [Candidatus Pacearchaeota archaeon RBG_13_36_9]|nr:MAG: hypothetical protein A3K73_06750 [Candidatus Pacearchaeota archaeon RBG_13_36_9]